MDRKNRRARKSSARWRLGSLAQFEACYTGQVRRPDNRSVVRAPGFCSPGERLVAVGVIRGL